MKLMKSVLQFFDGKKTYIVAAALLLAAIIYFWLGQASARDATLIALAALGLAALRGAIDGGGKRKGLLK